MKTRRLHAFKQRIIHFANDLLDRAAVQEKKSFQIPDVWATILVVLTAIGSFSEAFQRVVIQTFDLPGSLFLLIVGCFGFFWCVHVIQAKKQKSQGLTIPGAKKQLYYRYGQPVRFLSKIGLVILLAFTPRMVSGLLDDLVPLPSTIYGYLLDAETSRPVVGAQVRVINKKGVDVTRDAVPTDSEGMFIVEVWKRVTRSATLEIRRSGCQDSKRLLRRADEFPDREGTNRGGDRPKTIFRYVIDCVEP